MVPVPFMRVVLNDHTVVQATVGTIIGPVVALVWWRLVRCLQHRFVHMEGKTLLCGLLVHNYKLPRFHLTREHLISSHTDSGFSVNSGSGVVAPTTSRGTNDGAPEPSGPSSLTGLE